MGADLAQLPHAVQVPGERKVGGHDAGVLRPQLHPEAVHLLQEATEPVNVCSRMQLARQTVQTSEKGDAVVLWQLPHPKGIRLW